jgi:hypothetical protein
MTAGKPKLYLPKFHSLKNPEGFISLHQAVNRIGQVRFAGWGQGAVWKSHPFFYKKGKFERFKLEKGQLKHANFGFKPDAISTAREAARIYKNAIDILAKALETHDLVGYALTEADAPETIPRYSTQWIAQEKGIFSTGYMKRQTGRFARKFCRIVVRKDAFERWLDPSRPSKNFNKADNEFIHAAVKILDEASATNGHFKFSVESLWQLLRGDLSAIMKRATFREQVYGAVRERSRMTRKGAPEKIDLEAFRKVSSDILERVRAETTVLRARLPDRKK